MTPTEEWWRAEHGEYITFAEDVRAIYLETRDQALGKSAIPPGIGDSCLIVQYRETGDPDYLRYAVDMIEGEIEYLDEVFPERKLTPEFVRSWSTFKFFYGYVFAHINSGDDTKGTKNRLLGAAKSSKVAQRKWVATLLLRAIENGRAPKQAEADVAKAIELLLDAKGPDIDGFPRMWFDDILKNGALKSSYRQKALPEPKLREAAATEVQIPSLEITLPKT